MYWKRLAELADLAVTETPFSKLSLDNLGNEEAIRRRLEVECEKHLRAKDGVSGLTDRIQKVMGETLTRAKEPREEHLAISGDVHEIGEEFLPSLRYPGDPQAPPSQTIRCHCYLRRVN